MRRWVRQMRRKGKFYVEAYKTFSFGEILHFSLRLLPMVSTFRVDISFLSEKL